MVQKYQGQPPGIFLGTLVNNGDKLPIYQPQSGEFTGFPVAIKTVGSKVAKELNF